MCDRRVLLDSPMTSVEAAQFVPLRVYWALLARPERDPNRGGGPQDDIPASVAPGDDCRGTVRPGARADLVVFDPAAVMDRATYEEPHRFCAGAHHVFVDGTEVVREGKDTGAVAGVVLRRQPAGFVRHER
jgi:hypothetical protein